MLMHAFQTALLLQALDESICDGPIQWERVAAAAFGGSKSSYECSSQFHEHIKPYLNVKVGAWMPIEHVFLGAAIQKVSAGSRTVDWTSVSELLKGSRTPEQCKRKWVDIKMMREQGEAVGVDIEIPPGDQNWHKAISTLHREIVIPILWFRPLLFDC